MIGVISYPSMPEILAVHYGAKGVPDRLAAKSVGSAFSLVFVQIGVTAFAGGYRGGHRPQPARHRPGAPDRLRALATRYLTLGATAVLGLVAMIDLGMLGSSLLMWSGTVTSWAPLVVVFPILAGVVVAVVVLANRDDHALWVQRRFGLGWTLNFGNPRAAMLLAGVVALIGLVITLRFGG